MIPVIRTRGGVYFQVSSFGITFEATSVLVLGASSRGTKRGVSAINLGASAKVVESDDEEA